MKKSLILFLLSSVLACHKDEPFAIEPDPVLGPVKEATGALSNAAAVDGCGLLFSVERDSLRNDDYAIDKRSASLASQFLVYERGIAKRNVVIKFQQTNRRGEVLCGFSGVQLFDELLILSIKPTQ